MVVKRTESVFELNRLQLVRRGIVHRRIGKMRLDVIEVPVTERLDLLPVSAKEVNYSLLLPCENRFVFGCGHFRCPRDEMSVYDAPFVAG